MKKGWYELLRVKKSSRRESITNKTTEGKVKD